MRIVHRDRTLKEIVEERERNQAAADYQIGCAFWKKEWLDFNLWDMGRLRAGNVVEEPAIIEHTMTTFVIPPGKQVEWDEHQVLWYR